MAEIINKPHDAILLSILTLTSKKLTGQPDFTKVPGWENLKLDHIIFSFKINNVDIPFKFITNSLATLFGDNEDVDNTETIKLISLLQQQQLAILVKNFIQEARKRIVESPKQNLARQIRRPRPPKAKTKTKSQLLSFADTNSNASITKGNRHKERTR